MFLKVSMQFINMFKLTQKINLLMTSEWDIDKLMELTWGKLRHMGFCIKMELCAWLYMEPPILFFYNRQDRF